MLATGLVFIGLCTLNGRLLAEPSLALLRVEGVCCIAHMLVWLLNGVMLLWTLCRAQWLSALRNVVALLLGPIYLGVGFALDEAFLFQT
ncbi:hypothetical protein ACKC9G_09620 [Pokkaliibacter sp. CJK22405]|uniref:hypothetical protein n=1 Tax=Pokkaliibacter sp. CJK22405 TaxID=3384615 RepID=UPI0039854CDB